MVAVASELQLTAGGCCSASAESFCSTAVMVWHVEVGSENVDELLLK